MHKFRILIGTSAFAGFCYAAAVSNAADIPAPPALSTPAMQTASAERTRLICRDRIATGSRLAYARDCHTRAEWDAITRMAREYVTGQQLKGFEAGKPCGNTC